MCNKIVMITIMIVICCNTNTVVSQQAVSNSEKSSIIDFILCGFENNGANCVRRLVNELSTDLLIAKRHLYVRADVELERNLEARRLTVYELHGYKPSSLMRVVESSFKGIVDMIGGVLREIWSQPRTSITSRQFDSGDQEYSSDGYNEVRGKKKKHKHLNKGMLNIFMILSIIKAKIDLICKIISTQLQIQFAIISIISLILNIARFWLDYRQSRNPSPYSYPSSQQQYSNDQQNSSYDDTNKQPGYYPRSISKRTSIYQQQENEAQALAYSAYGPY